MSRSAWPFFVLLQYTVIAYFSAHKPPGLICDHKAFLPGLSAGRLIHGGGLYEVQKNRQLEKDPKCSVC